MSINFLQSFKKRDCHIFFNHIDFFQLWWYNGKKEKGTFQMFNTLTKDGRPLIVWPTTGIIFLLVIVMIYAALSPFSLVFKTDGEVVYTQDDVTILSDFEKSAAESEGNELVYGEDAEAFYFESGEEMLNFKEEAISLKLKMLLTAVTNFVSFKWDKENFVIELTSK